MEKRLELSDQKSCFNKASAREPIFVLRAVDPAAAFIIRMWCAERVYLGLNEPNDVQVFGALKCASEMVKFREESAKHDEIRPEAPSGG